MASPTLELIHVDQFKIENLSEPFLVHDSSSATLDTLTKNHMIGITGAGVRLILSNWNTYINEPWIETVFILPSKGVGPTLPTIPVNYSIIMKSQVDTIADLYDDLLAKRTEQGTPKMSASFIDKLKWGMENVDSLRNLTTETMLDWIAEGTKVNFEDE